MEGDPYGSPQIKDIYGGEFLKAEDIQSEEEYTITGVELTEMNDKQKVVLEFEETNKRWPLNKTNAKRIERLHGSDWKEGWKGKKIKIIKTITSLQGRDVDALRVKIPEV